MRQQTSKTSPWRIAAAACLWAAAAAAQAVTPATRSSYELRYFGLATYMTQPYGSYEGSDRFNNGDPYNTMVYENTTSPSFNKSGSYNPSTFGAGAESIGPAGDFLGSQFGIGGLAFRAQDATLSTDTTTPAPYSRYSLALSPKVVPNTALGLASKTAGLDTSLVWNATTPEPGSALLLILGGSSGDYTDRLQVRLYTDAQSGQSFVAFEQQARVGSVVTRTTLESHALADLYGGLGQVDYIGFELLRDIPTAADPNPLVHARVELFDAALDGDGGLLAAKVLDFGASAATFGSSNFLSVSAAASWLDPLPVVTSVPEPAPAALMLAGLLAVGARARCRR